MFLQIKSVQPKAQGYGSLRATCRLHPRPKDRGFTLLYHKFCVSLAYIAERNIGALKTYSTANALRKIADVMEFVSEAGGPRISPVASQWHADAMYCLSHLFDFPTPPECLREEGGDLIALMHEKYAQINPSGGIEQLNEPIQDDE